MAVIQSRILASNFELVRDRIGEILSKEFAFQKSYGDADLNKLDKIWVSRTVPFSHAELPAINVNFMQMSAISQDSNSQTNTYKYSIDVHAGAKTNTSKEEGDALALNRAQKIAGMCSKILSHWLYKTLAFAPPSVQNRYVESIDVAELKNSQDAESLAFVRLVLAVRHNEDVALKSAIDLKGWDTKINIGTTSQGYFYQVIGY